MEQLDMGRLLRDQGIARVDAVESPWQDRAWEVLLGYARREDAFNAEDIRSVVGEPPKPAAWGALFMRANRAELVEPVGFRQATHAAGRARKVLLYRGTQQAKTRTADCA